MRMNEWHHDIYPKTNLNGGYLGDGYPICSEAPEGSFLAQGARYNFVGKDGSISVLIIFFRCHFCHFSCTSVFVNQFQMSSSLF